MLSRLFACLALAMLSLVSNATSVSDMSDSVVEESKTFLHDFAEWYASATSDALFSIGDTTVSAVDLIWVVAVMVTSVILSSVLRRFLNNLPLKHSSFSASGMFTFGRLLHYVILFAALLICFGLLGIDFTELAIVAGALSVGIGFGLQSIFNNFISGLILLFERPIKVGDLIELDSGTRGRVKAINVRSTQVTTWDNIDVMVPNSEFISGRVINYTLNDDRRRLHIPFGVAYGTDKELVKRAATEAALALSCTLNHGKHKPDVWLVNFGDSSLDFELVVWVRGNQLPVNKHPIGMYLWEIESKLAEYKIEIPFPQRDLRMRSVDPDVRDLFSDQPDQPDQPGERGES